MISRQIHPLWICIATIVLAHNGAIAQETEYRDGIIAVVNDDAITVYDVSVFNAEQEKKIRAEFGKKDMNNSEVQNLFLKEINSSRSEGVNELVNQKLIQAEFDKKGYQLPNELVDKRIDSIAAAQAGGDWVKFEEMLAESSTSLEELRDRIKKNLSVELLMSQTVDRNINIAPESIESYYREHKEGFTTPAKVRLMAIALKRKPAETVGEHRRRGETTLTALRGGADFEEFAVKNSDQSNNKNRVDLGWMFVSDIRHEFKNGFKTIAKDEISTLIELQDTIYIVKVSDMQVEVVESLDEVYSSIKHNLFLSEKERRYQEYIEELRSKSYVRLFFKE